MGIQLGIEREYSRTIIGIYSPTRFFFFKRLETDGLGVVLFSLLFDDNNLVIRGAPTFTDTRVHHHMWGYTPQPKNILSF